MDQIAEQFSQSIELLISKGWSWLDKLVLSVPNVILVILVLFVGTWLIKFVNKYIRKVLSKAIHDKGVRNLCSSLITVTLYIILVLLVLMILGLDGPIKTTLATAGVAGLAIGLALQDPLMNLFSGVIISIKSQFQVGDFVETNGYIGSIQDISMKATNIRKLSGEEVSIPNKLVLQNPLTNFSTNGLRRYEISCGVSYADNLNNVKQIAMDSVKHLAVEDGVVPRPVEFIYTGFGNSSIDFQLRVWTNPGDVWEFLEAKSNAIMALKVAFDANDITIPFPITTLDFGIKGGKTLSEMSVVKN